MQQFEQQQLIISGVGGQGVLFVTRLLAEAAIDRGLAVFTSETHGMAQRGGTVVSHLKVGPFESPLVRPKQADGMLALKAESVALHGAYVKEEGWVVANSQAGIKAQAPGIVWNVDAEAVARRINNVRAINLVTLGFALSRLAATGGHQGLLFCTIDDILAVLQKRLAGKSALLASAREALAAGAHEDFSS
jgi:indolepyruvate ferredoxin oxidoreductase beta subunit